MSKFPGIYEALVGDVGDPTGQGRARLLVPAVLGEALSAWARPVLGVGIASHIGVGDRAWVLFEDGNLSRPAWICSLPSVFPSETHTHDQYALSDRGVITGEIKMWPTTAAPSGYFLCAGGTFSSLTDPELANLLGDTFGTHSGTTYFLPDFRGRSPLGVGTAVPAVAGGTAHTLGQKGGEEKHTLLESELAAHSHTASAGNQTAQHTHGTGVSVTTAFGTAGSGGYSLPSSNATSGIQTSTETTNHSHIITVNSAGSSTPHNVLSPFLGINFIIKR